MHRLAFLVLVLASSLALAQAPTRVRGTISAVDGDTVTVENKTRVRLGEKTEIVFTQPIALAEIKPGSTRITVPPDASVSTLVPGERSQLVPGAPVSLTQDANGVAIRIQVSPPKR